MTSSCNTCEKSFNKRNSIVCKFCHSKVHLKYNYLNYVESQYLKYSNKEWQCIECCNNLFTFTQKNNYKQFGLFSGQSFCNKDSNQNCLVLKTHPKMCHVCLNNSIISYLIQAAILKILLTVNNMVSVN